MTRRKVLPEGSAADLRRLRKSHRACREPRNTKKPQDLLGAHKMISEKERARERKINGTPADCVFTSCRMLFAKCRWKDKGSTMFYSY